MTALQNLALKFLVLPGFRGVGGDLVFTFPKHCLLASFIKELLDANLSPYFALD